MTNLINQVNNFVMVPLPNVNSLLGKTLTISFDAKLTNVTNAKVTFYWLSNFSYTDQLGDFVQVNSNGSYSVTATVPASIPSGSTRLAVALYPAGSAQPVSSVVEFSNIQVEVGTATTYEPYVGGVPAPNPNYPQAVQTVTGEQTITINSTSYTVDLGSIELCKIGDYQDYIWKDGDTWKMHKATGKAELWNGSNWRRLNTGTTGEYRFSVKVSNTDIPTSSSSSTLVDMYSNYWPACTRLQTYQKTQGIATTVDADLSVESFIAFVDSLKTSDIDGWKAWLTANMPVVYYPSTTPTDTEITNAALIEQLEALVDGAAKVYAPTTHISTSSPGDLPNIFAARYYTGKDPDQRDELIIDSRLRTITLNGLDVYHLQAPGSEFLMLAPGENKLSLQSDIVGDNGYAKVSYKQGYLGI